MLLSDINNHHIIYDMTFTQIPLYMQLKTNFGSFKC